MLPNKVLNIFPENTKLPNICGYFKINAKPGIANTADIEEK